MHCGGQGRNMSNFEFVFSLFGLMLGLSMAEVMSGLSRTMKAHKRVRIGWLTPLLGLLLIVDLVSFWVGAWDNRAAIPVTFTSMLYGAGVACIYYLAASLVFPERPEEWDNLDEYFFANKQFVIAGVLIANLARVLGVVLLNGTEIMRHPIFWILFVLLTSSWLAAIAARGQRANMILLLWMLALFPLIRLFRSLGAS
jgi:hypothetical protein